MESQTVVAYVTAGGASERYAQVFAETLRSKGLTVDVVDLKLDGIPDLSPYENVVVCTGVRMTMVYRKAKLFLGRKELKGKRLAVFLSSGIAVQSREKARERFLTPLMKKLGLTPLMYDALPGIMPAPGGKTNDQVDTELARQRARELAGRLGERS